MTSTLILNHIWKVEYFVQVNEATSDCHDIMAGVYKGSVLRPILYLVYTTDIPEIQNVMMATFADDTAALTCNVDPASELLQEHLDKIDTLMTTWCIKASAAKSSHINIYTQM